MKEYSPEYDRGIACNDAVIAIDRPVRKLLLSDKGARCALLKNADRDFVMHEA